MGAESGEHDPRCERAQQDRCRCGTCGGSLHGFGKWLAFVDPKGDDLADEAVERRRVKKELANPRKSDQGKWVAASLRACVDFFRLSIVDWMKWDSTRISALPLSAATAGRRVGRQEEWQFDPAAPAHVTIRDLAFFVGRPSWRLVEQEVKAEVKAKVAESHLWCDLFLGLAEAVQSISDTTTTIAASLKDGVKRSLYDPRREKIEKVLTEALVDKVIDKAVSQLLLWLGGVHPLLDPDVRAQLVRLLRILAVLCCPAPSKHKDLRQYAMAPLAADAADVVSEEAKEQMDRMFEDWMQTVDVVRPRRSGSHTLPTSI